MSEILMKTLAETWSAAFMAAPWILLGLLVAGLLYAYLPANLIRRGMGGKGLGAILRAAFIGAPLPLCSCGVIPTALYLRKEGAGRGPVLSFLISTPETNVDSVALTYALMGPIMAVARPVAAIFSAVAAGLGERIWGAPDPHVDSGGDCACRLCDAHLGTASTVRPGLRGAIKYGAVVLMRDLAPWLVLGLVLTGMIGALVPADFFSKNLGGGILPMLLMALLATPIYMCTTASTPVAAMLVAKGVSPGAALVFLLVGPATNLATMTTVGRFLGRRSLLIYLLSMVGTSLLLGLGLDSLAGARIAAAVSSASGHADSVALQILMWVSMILFLILVANGMRLRLVPYWLGWRFGKAREPKPTPEAAADPCCASGCCTAEAGAEESHETDSGSGVEECACDHDEGPEATSCCRH